jgi:predicted lactoylglutathione lyase
MSRMVFPNLPVADVERARTFWTALGFEIDDQFSDGKACCLVLNELCNVMLLQEEFFHSFHATTSSGSGTEVLICISAETREEVDELCDRAAAAGATDTDERTGERTGDGPMYGGSFRDLDGHVWEVMYMDMTAMA